MSRRLSKKSRAQKLTSTSAANMPKLGSRALELPFAGSMTRKTRLRASLMVGTALSAGILASAVVGTTLIDVRPAAAGACTAVAPAAPYAATWDCEGASPFTNINSLAGVADPAVVVNTLIETGQSAATTIGANAFGNGIGMTAGVAVGLTLGVTTSAITSIGTPAGFVVPGDGIFVQNLIGSGIGLPAAINITNAAAIGVGGTGIFAEILDVPQLADDTITIVTTGTNTIAAGTSGIDATIVAINPVSLGITNSISITNAQPIAAGGIGIAAFNLGVGDITVANTITNTGAIVSGLDSIFSPAIAIDPILGGTAKATSSVTNSGTLTSIFGEGIDAAAFAFAHGPASTATADTTIVNNAAGAILSDFTGIVGTADAMAPGFGTAAGTATAGVYISNKAAIASAIGGGIVGESFAAANSKAAIAVGGTATANTGTTANPTYNSGAITGTGDGILATSKADANGFGGFAAGDSGTGGSATAGVVITNAAAGAIGTAAAPEGGDGIHGASVAAANGFGYSGFGGTASATTTITNAASIYSKADGILGTAEESASGIGFGAKGKGYGGVAPATVFISNSGAIGSKAVPVGGVGLDGASLAKANGFGFTAKGGTATATTTIDNAATGIIFSTGAGVIETATALADGIAKIGVVGSSGAGGTATASTYIENFAAITSTTADGIFTFTVASADGKGYTAMGGTATANKAGFNTVANLGAISASKGDGIDVVGVADAVGFGSFKAKGSGTGGSATASAVITNTATGTIGTAATPVGIDGLVATSKADADGFGYAGKGGTAGADSGVYNSAPIFSTLTGIVAAAGADADGVGSGKAKGTGTGGTATAGVVISNAATIGSKAVPVGGFGLDGASFAKADGFAYTAKGGTATATTTITNAAGGVIYSKLDGMIGTATADADGFAPIAAKGSLGTGGTATATVYISNKAAITSKATGIAGEAAASAVGFGYTGVGGTAKAYAGTGKAPIYNSGVINSVTDGIFATAGADADGIGSGKAKGTGTGGTATAGVTITNAATGAITSTKGDAIFGGSFAKADGVGYSGYGGKGTATTTISNAGALTAPAGDGILGIAAESASGFGTGAKGKGYGGVAPATVLIVNAGPIGAKGAPVGGVGIDGGSLAIADGKAFIAKGGTATATTTIDNAATGIIFSTGDGVFETATAFADGIAPIGKVGSSGTGGTASASTYIENFAAITSTKADGIFTFTVASADGKGYTAMGGTATANTATVAKPLNTIANLGAISSVGDGIDGAADADASGIGSFKAKGSGAGGTANASLVITNTAAGAITSTKGDAIVGASFAKADGVGYAAVGGTATAFTDIFNAAPLAAPLGDGILGTAAESASGFGSFKAKGTGYGGVAPAIVMISNSGAIGTKAVPVGLDGIDGGALAVGDGFGFKAKGGTATASTTISNSGVIYSKLDGILGTADAAADGKGAFAKGGSGKGGTATATVTITNTGAGKITSFLADGIDGLSFASATGFGYTATGGTAKAGTYITNSGAIASLDYGIKGGALAFANGFGSKVGPGGAGSGGTATATVTISNTGAISDKFFDSIDGFTVADAEGFGYTAKGGTATATTTISNTGVLTSFKGTSILGTSFADASAFAPIGAKGSSGTGGTATATTTITTATGAIETVYFGNGIEGDSGAKANGFGYTGTGGTAKAGTYITNSAYVHTLAAGSGILGTATADANGIGSFAPATIFGAPGGKGTGGTATSTVTISNTGTLTVTGKGVDGIGGATLSKAVGVGFAAAGGTATATTNINNGGPITADAFAGISGKAGAFAGGYGSFKLDGPGSGNGGTAIAGVNITNAGAAISTIGFPAFGIYGASFAKADGKGYAAKGGTAEAGTSITNSGTITTALGSFAGIDGTATSVASALGSHLGGSAKGGTATSTVTISNTGNIYNLGFGGGIIGTAEATADASATEGKGGKFVGSGTATGGSATATVTITDPMAFISSGFGPGIAGTAIAHANATASLVGGTATGGTAKAGTYINSTAAIDSYGAGITGKAIASADAKGGTAKGGNAGATVKITNTGTIETAFGPGIAGFSGAFANADGNTGGTANAATAITNSGSVYSGGDAIFGGALAIANGGGALTTKNTGGTATAMTIINNTSATLVSASGDGIDGFAKAVANGYGVNSKAGTATATVAITNTAGTIFAGKDGIDSATIAVADAFGEGATGGTATATTTLTDPSKIYAVGDGIHVFDGAFASGEGLSAMGGTAKAGTYITNTGNIYSGGRGIAAISVAVANNGDGGGLANATTTVSNSGFIKTYGDAAGIFGKAVAVANGSLTKATAGSAAATVNLSNTGDILTINHASPGMYGVTFADASGLKGGAATAKTYVTNTGVIATTAADWKLHDFGSPGILAYSTAFSSRSGTATAITTVTNSGNIATAGPFSPGINAASFAAGPDSIFAGTASATTTVNNSASIVTGLWASDGIDASSAAFGVDGAVATTSVTNSSDIRTSFDRSFGIDATSFAAGDPTATTSVTNTGVIVTQGVGIFAGSVAISGLPTSGTATATTTVINGGVVSTYGGFSPGIVASANAVSLMSAASATTNVNNSGSVDTSGNDSPGIAASTYARAYTNTATATTHVTNSGSVSTGVLFGLGDPSPGIWASAIIGPSSTVGGTGATATVTNTGSVTTYFRNSPGIVAFAQSQGAATAGVTNSGSVTTYGSSSPGIGAYARALAGKTSNATATVLNNAGDTVLTGMPSGFGVASPGIVAFAYVGPGNTGGMATATVTNAGSVMTYYARSPGIVATAIATGKDTAGVTVSNSGSVLTFGWASPGIAAYASTETGANVAIAISNSGVIHTYGAFSDAVFAQVSSKGRSGSAETITVTNTATGIIIAGTWPYHAIVASGANTTITNAAGGYIFGNVQVDVKQPEFVNTFTNNGRWVMAGDSAFGGNVGTAVNNTGTVSMVVPGSTPEISPDLLATPRTFFNVVTLNGLETFNNSGVVTLLDPPKFSIYNRIVIANYTGKQTYFNGLTGSTLKVAAFLGGPGSAGDVLQIGGVAKGATALGYATGATAVVVNNTDPGFGVYNPVGIPVVESSGAPGATPKGAPANVATNFALAKGPIVDGLFQYNLFYLPQGAAGNPCQAGFNCWFLASTPSANAFDLVALETAAQNIFRDASGTWLDRTADLRDYYFYQPAPVVTKEGPTFIPVGAGPGAWFRAFGDWASASGTANFAAFGTTVAQNISYNQSTGGAQIGADFAALRSGYSTLVVGMLGGVVDSNLDFASGTHASFQGGNGGVYATWLNQGFFADALFLANDMKLNLSGSGIAGGEGIAANNNVLQLGGHLDTGYRFQFDRWFVEPEATIEYVHTQFGELALPGANVDLNNDGIFGRLGGRIGTWWNYSTYLVEPSLTGGVWQTFSGTNVAKLTSDGFVLNIGDATQPTTLGEIGGMLNVVQLARGWSAFVKGDYYFGNGYHEGMVDGGVRYQW